MSDLSKLLENVELSPGEWMRKLPGYCPFCGCGMELESGANPNVGTWRCPACGFGGMLSAPECLRDTKWEDPVCVDDVEGEENGF